MVTPTPDKLHIFPVTNGKTTHCTDKWCMCWCKPRNMQPCPENEPGAPCTVSCWRCHGENLVEPYNKERDVLIVHSKHQRPLDELDAIPPNIVAFLFGNCGGRN